MSQKVTAAVLGCGPAGLLAAHTLEREGIKSIIYSAAKVPSYISGAQYLHEPIPGLTNKEPDAFLKYFKVGTREGYATKVYGSPDAPCSWDHFPEGEVPAWSLRDVYSKLWERYQNQIATVWLEGGAVEMMAKRTPIVVSTIPLTAICRSLTHSFQGASVWIQKAPNRKHQNSITYNGDPMTGWYRSSTIDGEGFCEYGYEVEGAVKGVKPTFNTCDCHPEVIRAGRFGSWTKGVLVHDVIKTVSEAINRRGLVAA